jgi:hypothetical protein
MKFDVNQGNVDWIVRRLNEAMGNGQFSSGEAVLGIAEFVGRVIVTLAEEPHSGFQAAQALTDHISATMKAGYIAKGYNMGRDVS